MKKFPYFSTFFVLISVFLCVSIGYLCSTLLLSSNLFTTTSKVENLTNTYYLLTIFHDETQENCQNVQADFQNQNFAGYIFEKDGVYYIIASIYDNANDAELVKNTLANEFDVEILTYQSENIILEGEFSMTEQQVLKEGLQVQNKTYKELYDVSISLDTNVYDELTARLKINEIYSNFLTTKNNFETIFFENEDDEIEKIRASFDLIEKELAALTTCKENLSSQIKLTYSTIILSDNI